MCELTCGNDIHLIISRLLIPAYERGNLGNTLWEGGFSIGIVGLAPDTEGWLPHTWSRAP